MVAGLLLALVGALVGVRVGAMPVHLSSGPDQPRQGGNSNDSNGMSR